MCDQGGDFGRNAPIPWERHEYCSMFGFGTNINRTKLSAFKCVVHYEACKQRDAETLDGRVTHHDPIIDAKYLRGMHRFPAPRVPETPVGSAARAVDDATVPFQIGDVFRHPIFPQIGRRSHQHAFAGCKPFHDQSVIRYRPMTYDSIETVCEVDEAVVEFERQLDSRILFEKGADRRAQMTDAEADRSG